MNPTQIQSAALMYFSPTHTTRKVLRAVAAGMNLGRTTEVNLTSPASRSNFIPPPPSDLLLLGMPVYEERIPSIILPLLNRLEGRNRPAVVVAVYGNVGFGIALQEMAAVLTARGFRVVAGAAFIGEHSFSHNRLPLAAGRPDKQDLQTARSFGARVAVKLSRSPELLPDDSPVMPGKLPWMTRILPPNSSALFARPPELDPEVCTQCNACVRACPTGAIDPESLQIDESACLRCFACVRACYPGARNITLRKKWISYPFLKAQGKRPRRPLLIL